jgi:hypothetical protein
MIIKPPLQITARLLPGIQIGEGWISIEYDGWTNDNRSQYGYHIDIPEYSYSSDDLASGVGGGSLQSGLEALLSFLAAFAESVNPRWGGTEGEHSDLFPRELRDWAVENSDEFSMVECELTESEEPFILENE